MTKPSADSSSRLVAPEAPLNQRKLLKSSSQESKRKYDAKKQKAESAPAQRSSSNPSTVKPTYRTQTNPSNGRGPGRNDRHQAKASGRGPSGWGGGGRPVAGAGVNPSPPSSAPLAYGVPPPPNYRYVQSPNYQYPPPSQNYQYAAAAAAAQQYYYSHPYYSQPVAPSPASSDPTTAPYRDMDDMTERLKELEEAMTQRFEKQLEDAMTHRIKELEDATHRIKELEDATHRIMELENELANLKSDLMTERTTPQHNTHKNSTGDLDDATGLLATRDIPTSRLLQEEEIRPLLPLQEDEDETAPSVSEDEYDDEDEKVEDETEHASNLTAVEFPRGIALRLARTGQDGKHAEPFVNTNDDATGARGTFEEILRKKQEERKAAESNQLALLPEDTFSLLVFSRQWVTLGVAFLTMIFQVATLSILIADVIDIQQNIHDDPDDYIPNNPLKIPAAVPWQVVVAQLFALLITLLSEDDIKWALNIFISGYHPALVKRALLVGHQRAAAAAAEGMDVTQRPDGDDESHEFGHRLKGFAMRVSLRLSRFVFHERRFTLPQNLEMRWRVANFARFTVGCMSLSSTFMLIVQSETVLDILLNFTAIEFISRIDNAVFALAKWGYFGTALKEDANHLICNNRKFTILTTYKCSSDWHFVWNLFLRVVLAIIFIGCWSWVLFAQNSGRYLSNEIYVQMGDPSDLSLGTYSGIYVRTAARRRRESRRFAWVAQKGSGELTYCISERAWVFRDPQKNSTNSCGWILKSESSKSFNVLSTAGENWFLEEEFNLQVPVERMLLAAHNNENKPGGKLCALPRTYGLNCEFKNVCPMLAVDARRPNFMGDRDIPTEFTLVENLDVYDRPVYIGTTSEKEAPHVLMFTGRRWIIASTFFWVDDDESFLDADGVAAVLDGFRVPTFLRRLGVAFLSERVDAATSENSVTPENLAWFYAEAEQDSDVGRLVNIDVGRDIETTLLCTSCNNDERTCFFDAPCVENQCLCNLGSEGTRCEVPATGNGFCNSNLNSRQFSYDRGDCCMPTCRNSESFSCGKSLNRFNDIRNVECNLQEASAGWAMVGELSISGSTDVSDFGGAVSLTSEGTTLLVGAPAGDGVVNIFRQDGSEWTTETADVTIAFGDEGFGRRVLIAESIPNSISNPLRSREMVVAGYSLVVSRGSFTTYVYLYFCSSGSCEIGRVVFSSSAEEEEEESQPSDTDVLFNPIGGLLDDNSTSFDLPYIGFTTPITDITFSGGLSSDGRYFCTGGEGLTMYQWDQTEKVWLEFFTLEFLDKDNGKVGIVNYVEISTVKEQAVEDDSGEYIIAVGLKWHLADMKLTVGAPLVVRVFHWVVGAEPQQLGNEFVSDYHLVADLVAVQSPDAEEDDLSDSLTILQNSLHLSSNGTILVYSSFFLSEESDLTSDDIDPLKSNVTDSVLMEYDNALEAIVFVRLWDGNEWTLRDKFVLGRKQDEALVDGWVTSVSADAGFIAIGSLEEVVLYHWNGTAYEQETVIPNSQELPALSLSGDGSSIAIGRPSLGVSGMVQVYQNDRYSPCSIASKLMHLSFTTGDATAMTRWQVKREGNQILREGGPYSLGEADLPGNVTFVYKECFADCSSMSVESTSASEVDEGTFAAFFDGRLVETSDEEAQCKLVLSWSGLV